MTAADAQGARDDPQGDRRHRAAVRLQHAGRGGDGARERDLARRPATRQSRFAAETAVSLIQPYAPHIAEELWAALGHSRLWAEPWPVADESLLERDTVQLVCQVNGKVRDRIEVPAGLPDDELVARARASERVQAHLNGKEPKVFVVPDKLVNFVV